MLIEKYKPLKISEIIGQSDALRKLVLCIKEKKPVLIYGPTGCGKTSSVIAVANELNYDIIELNSSDFRSKAKIQEIVGNSVQQQSLFSKSKIILIDEIEGLSGQKDRGCLAEIMRLIDISRFPIILITNKLNHDVSALKKKAHAIEFKELDARLVYDFLRIISLKENVKADDFLLKTISNNCCGDMRAAINDLSAANLSSREREKDIYTSLKSVFKGKTAAPVLDAFDNIEEDLNECLLWVDENLPKEYSGEDLKKAYDYLSKADIFRKRIMRWQYYRFLSYVSTFLTAGIASSKTKVNEKQVDYKRSTRILKMWIAKQRNAKRKEIAVEIAKNTHCSVKKAMSEMPIIELFIK